MLPMLLFIAVVLGLFIRKLTPEERIQLVHKSLELTQSGIAAARRFARVHPTGATILRCAPCAYALVTGHARAPYRLRDDLLPHVRSRKRVSRVTTAAPLGRQHRPRTTNGEWWRLVTAMFVHWGLLHLIADVAGLAQIGRLTERLVGPTTFAFVFVAAGLVSGLRELSVHPVAVNAGASGRRVWYLRTSDRHVCVGMGPALATDHSGRRP